MNTNRLLIGTAIGAGALAAYSYVRSISRAQAELQIIPNARIHKLSRDGLTIRVDALIKNPTQGSFNIKFPFIEIEHGGQLVGSSQVVNQDIKIVPFGQVLVEGMMVNIPVTSLASTVYDVVSALINNQPIVFTVGTVTTIDLGWTSLAYESKQDLTLKK